MRFENGYLHILSTKFEICDSVISYLENNWNPAANGTGISYISFLEFMIPILEIWKINQGFDMLNISINLTTV